MSDKCEHTRISQADWITDDCNIICTECGRSVSFEEIREREKQKIKNMLTDYAACSRRDDYDTGYEIASIFANFANEHSEDFIMGVIDSIGDGF